MTVVVSPQHLRARATRYLRTHTFDGQPLRSFFRKFEALGSVAIFGGFARDMALNGASGFRSDIDLVVQCEPDRLADFITELSTPNVTISRNKFGGYRVHDSKRVLDVWALETTWAVRMGFAEPVLHDLPKTTFFNWDAIAYCISTRELICSSQYFDQVRERLLDLNLRENPNPKGMCVRTLRAARRSGASLSRDLVAYVLQQGFTAEELAAYEGVGFTKDFVCTCLARMKNFLDSSSPRFVYEDQMSLVLR